MLNKVKTVFGTQAIAAICHVTRQTVARWIAEGKLPAFRTAGGQRRVWAADLVPFLRSQRLPVPRQVSAGAAPFQVLIVDDEAQIRKLVSRIVRRLWPDATVAEAADGFEAGHKMAELLPRLFILDVHLPGVDGERVCRMARAAVRGEGRILAMSGVSAGRERERMLLAGADDFVGKPFDCDELERKLEALCGGIA